MLRTAAARPGQMANQATGHALCSITSIGPLTMAARPGWVAALWPRQPLVVATAALSTKSGRAGKNWGRRARDGREHRDFDRPVPSTNIPLAEDAEWLYGAASVVAALRAQRRMRFDRLLVQERAPPEDGSPYEKWAPSAKANWCGRCANAQYGQLRYYFHFAQAAPRGPRTHGGAAAGEGYGHPRRAGVQVAAEPPRGEPPAPGPAAGGNPRADTAPGIAGPL